MTAPSTARTPWPLAVAAALAVLLAAGVFYRASSAPVAPVDSWSHWKYGQWIWEHRCLPDGEPFSPYSSPGAKSIDAQWLSQVVSYLAEARGGLEGVALLYALLEAAKTLLLIGAARRAAGSLGVAVAVVALAEVLRWPFADAVRVQAPAEVCWAALLFVLARRVPSPAAVLGVPAVVALWANLSGTFPAAFLLIGGLLVGRFLGQARALRGPTRALRDPGLQRLILLAGLSVLAAFATPHGKTLLPHVLRLEQGVVTGGRWPDLIPINSPETRVLVASLLVVLFAFRLSPRPFATAEVLLVAAFAGGSWFDKRFVSWWLLLLPWLLAPHAQALLDALAAAAPAAARPRRWLTPVAWIGASLGTTALVLLSPAGAWLRGRPIPVEERAGPATPVRLAEVLCAEPERPRHVFCAPFVWGDYLLWRLPASDKLYWYSRQEFFDSRHARAGNALIADPASPKGQAVLRRLDAVVVSSAEPFQGLYDYMKHEGPNNGWDVLADETGAGVRGLVAVRRGGR